MLSSRVKSIGSVQVTILTVPSANRVQTRVRHVVRRREEELRQEVGAADRHARADVPDADGDDGHQRLQQRGGRRGSCDLVPVGLHHLGAQLAPDRLVQLMEARQQAHLAGIARAGRDRWRESPMMRASGPADMITTRSASAIASSRSCVTNSTALRSPAHSSSSRLPMIWRVCASSGPNGSSISRIFGSRISTCARPTRFLCPPESWCG